MTQMNNINFDWLIVRVLTDDILISHFNKLLKYLLVLVSWLSFHAEKHFFLKSGTQFWLLNIFILCLL